MQRRRIINFYIVVCFMRFDIAIVFIPFSPQRYGKKMKDERKGEKNLQITVITINSFFFKG